MSRAARGLALAAVLALLACSVPESNVTRPGTIGEALKQAGPPIVPALADRAMIAADGAQLPLRVWLPEGMPLAAIVALHGFNDYSNAFDGPGRALALRGIATYAYDQRGFGEAPSRGLWAGRQALAADLATATRLVRARHPGVPLYCLGESMGGAVVMVAASGETGAEAPLCDGLVLSAPAVWGRATQPFIQRAALWLGVRAAPDMVLTGRGLDVKPSDNIAMLRALARDPLVIKGTRVDTLYGLVELMDAALDAAPRLALPTLVLYGNRDEIVPRNATERMLGRLPADADHRIAWYVNGYHMLLRDLGAPAVVNDIASWIAAPAAPLPSTADRVAETVLAGKTKGGGLAASSWER